MNYDEARNAGKSILESLKEARVFEINKIYNETFQLTEMCDEWFGATLSKEDVIELANELIRLANE